MPNRLTISSTGSTSSIGTGGRRPCLEGEEPPQGRQPVRLLVDGLGVLLEDVVAACAGGVLQAEHRLRVEQVDLALAAPLVLAAGDQRAVVGAHAVRRVGAAVVGEHLLGEHVEPDAAQARRRAGEARVDHVLAEPDGLEDLRAGVGGDGGDAHLRHGLAHALAERLDQVLRGGRRVDAGDVAAGGEVLDGGHGQVRVDRGGAVAQQQRDVVHLAGVGGLGDQPDAGARALLDQVLVHGAGEQQRRDRGVVRVDAAAGQHDQPRAVLDRRRRPRRRSRRAAGAGPSPPSAAGNVPRTVWEAKPG